MSAGEVRTENTAQDQSMKNRNDINKLDDIPNIGPATVRYLKIIGITSPAGLVGQNPYSMFRELCRVSGKQFDPCLADIFVSAVKYMEGGPAQKWWYYTAERKEVLQAGQ